MVLAVLACEEPDYSGAKFKPDVPRPDAYKTAFQGYLFLRQPRDLVWGNEFLYHAQTLAEREYRPVSKARVVLDEVYETHTDANGLFGFQGLHPGFHSLRIHVRNRIENAIIEAAKGELTMSALELTSDGHLRATHFSTAHTFLTQPVLKQTIRMHQSAEKIVERFAQARVSRDRSSWDALLTESYSDPHGGREDFIRSMSSEAAAGRLQFRLMGFNATYRGDTARVLIGIEMPGSRDFQRLDLQREDRQSDRWKVSAVYL